MLKIRAAAQNDLPAILAIEGEQPFPWSMESLQNCFAEPYQCLVLEIEGKITGFGVISCVVDEGEIHNIVIAKAYRRCGYGRQLLQELLQIANQRGAKTVYLEVCATNIPAQELYKSLGFKTVGVRKDYYPTLNGRVDAVILRYTY